MIGAILLIKKFTLLLYVKPYQEFSFYQLFNYLWFSQDHFLQLILLFNFIIKPIFIYALINVVLYLLWKNN
ncbi:hypothetical protein clem_06390 [Legionella clemsonensis]|uniref:Uncharacterized protein n=1 Tax=Legionella clemsonensis TaxID=1867846 RepID=A0A222P1W6_9GAMM|nr:hypothetical protein clem_06390 [Legionella clemsonensis]